MTFEFCSLQSSTVTPGTVRTVPVLDYCEDGPLCVSLTDVNKLLEGTPLWRREGALSGVIPEGYGVSDELMTDNVSDGHH